MHAHDAVIAMDGTIDHYGYKIVGKDGAVLKSGKLDAEGRSERVFTEDMEELHAEIDMHDSQWQIVADGRHPIDTMAAAAGEPEAADGADEVVVEDNENMTTLSLSDAFAVDLDELPAELRGKTTTTKGP